MVWDSVDFLYVCVCMFAFSFCCCIFFVFFPELVGLVGVSFFRFEV